LKGADYHNVPQKAREESGSRAGEGLFASFGGDLLNNSVGVVSAAVKWKVAIFQLHNSDIWRDAEYN
jgi:hypothetical protein